MPPQMTDEQRRELEEKIKNMSPEELREFQKQQCIFCQIIAGKIPSKKVYEDDLCMVVMDINPAAPGHVLLFPKEHYAIMPQIPDKEIGHMFMVAKHLSQAMLKRLKVEGTNIFVANGLVAGQKAQHFMIHVIPRKEEDGVLNISEHLVEELAREKLGVAIENKVNELMGIKKEKVIAEKKKVEKEEKEKVEDEDLDEKDENSDTDSGKDEEGKKEDIEERDDDKEDDDKEDDIDENDKDGDEEEPEDEKSDDKVDLDDIAELFK